MKEIPFVKMHGLGNSYIYIYDVHLNDHDLVLLAQKVSNSNTGIGSDGLIWIGPSTKADVKMRIFNKDGSEAQNCGNGVRCVAKYVYDRKIVKHPSITIETRGGVVKAEIVENSAIESLVSVNMGKPRLTKQEIPMRGVPNSQTVGMPFAINGETLFLTAVSMGNPHAVFFVPHDRLELHRTLGPKIEKHPDFPEGINVEFVSIASPHSMHCRVWERGSGVTAACGTGACAVGVASVLNGHAKQGQPLTVHLAGGDLHICWEASGEIMMTGPATTIASGTLH